LMGSVLPPNSFVQLKIPKISTNANNFFIN
jgi:hypothetical protein